MLNIKQSVHDSTRKCSSLARLFHTFGRKIQYHDFDLLVAIDDQNGICCNIAITAGTEAPDVCVIFLSLIDITPT